jgi:hypothetical protein
MDLQDDVGEIVRLQLAAALRRPRFAGEGRGWGS